jgi:hypothetical protein
VPRKLRLLVHVLSKHQFYWTLAMRIH